MKPGLPLVIRLGVLFASANSVLAQTSLPPAAASTNAGSAAPTGKPATGEYWLKEAQCTNATQAVYDQAVHASDTEVAAAAEYNLLHLPLTGTNGPAIEAALRQLETVGDEFTARWLDILARRPEPDLYRLQLLATRARIEKRLAKALPRPAEKLVRERFLRAAVANMTCNPLESPLPRFVMQWAGPHASAPLFRAELRKFATETRSPPDMFWVAAVRRSAAMRATSLLEPAPAASK